jgi:hypothetical protein
MSTRPWNGYLRHGAPLVAVLGLLGPGTAAAADFGPDVPPPTALLAPDPAPVAPVAPPVRKPAAPHLATRATESVRVVVAPARPVSVAAAPVAPAAVRRTTTMTTPRPPARPHVARHRAPAAPAPAVRHALRPEPSAPRLDLVATATRALGGTSRDDAAVLVLVALALAAGAGGLGTIVAWRRAEAG